MDVMVAFCPLAHLQFMLSVHLIFVLVDTWLTDLGKKWFNVLYIGENINFFV